MALPPLPPNRRRHPWRKRRSRSAGGGEPTLSSTYPDRRYIAALAVTLVDMAQVIPYGPQDLTASHLDAWEWTVTGAFAAVTVVVAAAALLDRARMFIQGVYISGGLYAVVTMSVLSATEIRAQPRIMLSTVFAGVCVGLFTLWLALRRTTP